MLYNATPQPIAGSQPITVVYAQQMWPGAADRTKLPDESTLRAVIAACPVGQPVVLDIESMQLAVETWNAPVTAAQVRRNICRLSCILQIARSERPDLRFGLYESTVTDNYGGPTDAPADDAARALDDVADTLTLRPIADQSDFICPSLYVSQQLVPVAQWPAHGQRLMKRCRVWGKPVYPFVSPVGYPSGTPLPDATWQAQLSTVLRYCDGAIVWGGPGMAAGSWQGIAAGMTSQT